MEVRDCEVEMIQIGDRLRSIDSAKVDGLAESMAAIGLQQPISVWYDGPDVLELVSGLHRLEAARKLGWWFIDCIFVDMDDLDRQLWEIDENLMRVELGPAEMAQHTAKRAEVVKQKAQLLAKSANKSEAHRPDTGQTKFDAETAKQTGKSVRSVRSDKARGEGVSKKVLAKVSGTKLDKGSYLDKLKKVPKADQAAKVDRDLVAKNDINLKEKEARRKKKEHDLCFGEMHEILDKLKPTDVARFLELLAKVSSRTAYELRDWFGTNAN